MNIEIIRTAHPSLVMVGGACATNTAEDLFPDFKIEGPARDVIVVSTSLEETLSKEQFEAIIQHEMGHIELGHLKNIKLADCVQMGGAMVLDMPSFELEADAYSADRVGKGMMLSALGATLTWILSTAEIKVALKSNMAEGDALEDVLTKCKQQANLSLAYRFDALKVA